MLTIYKSIPPRCQDARASTSVPNLQGCKGCCLAKLVIESDLQSEWLLTSDSLELRREALLLGGGAESKTVINAFTSVSVPLSNVRLLAVFGNAPF